MTLPRTSGLPFGFVIAQCIVIFAFIYTAVQQEGAGRWLAVTGIIACVVGIALRVRAGRRSAQPAGRSS